MGMRQGYSLLGGHSAISLITCLLLITTGIAAAATWIEYQTPQPGKTPFCTDKIEGKKNAGDVWFDTVNCVQKKCLTDSQGTPLIHYTSCGKVADPPQEECRVVLPEGNLTYPACCPTVECDPPSTGAP